MQFIKNRKIQRAALQNSPAYPYGLLRPEVQDFLLDKAYFEEMRASAAQSGSAFLQGYVKLMADVANLRSAVRAARTPCSRCCSTVRSSCSRIIPLSRERT